MTINLTSRDGIILKTQGKYCDKDVTITPVLEEKTATAGTTAQEVAMSDGYCGISKVTVNPTPTQTKTVSPTTSSRTVTPDSGKYLSAVTVSAIQTETKSVTPTTSAQTVTPTSGKYLTQVTVGAVQTETKSATPTKAAQTITPTSGKYLSQVTVDAIPDDYIIPTGTLTVTGNGTVDVTNYASVVVSVDKPTLNAPTIALSDSTITITNPATNGNFVAGYKILVDGTETTTTTETTYDLSTLGLAAGDHVITVKAYGTNFNDSAASNSVTYTVLEQLATPTNLAITDTTVTWDEVTNATSYDVYVDGTLYENTTGGAVVETETWVLNETLDTTSVNADVSFTSNNLPFTLITRYYNESRSINVLSYNGATFVTPYGKSGWTDEAYRTITFDEPVTDATLLAWLQANGTKQ